MKSESGHPSHKDAIALLKADHVKVKTAFQVYESLSEKSYATKKKLADSICADLRIHTLVEEEIFYPAVKKASKEAGDLIDEATVEHASAKDLIAQIEAMSAEEGLFDAKVKVLSEQIEHHVKEEEQEMFPLAKKLKLDLVALGTEMAARKESLQLEHV